MFYLNFEIDMIRDVPLNVSLLVVWYFEDDDNDPMYISVLGAVEIENMW